MLYHVRTGELDSSVHASTHRSAAMKLLMNSQLDFGILTVVSDREIGSEPRSSNLYFDTQALLDECLMRIVD